MNPHFIFNSINTAQNFVLNSRKEEAYEYLADFARLLRMVLENSGKTFVPVEDEVQQLRLYIELERTRFSHKFNYEIQIDPQLENGVYEIPGMLIQPLVENAIGHGLMNRKDANGKLMVSLKLSGEQILCEVIDNGIGREKAAQIKRSKDILYPSTAIPNIKERLLTLQNLTQGPMDLEITDLFEQGIPAGTRVRLLLPCR